MILTEKGWRVLLVSENTPKRRWRVSKRERERERGRGEREKRIKRKLDSSKTKIPKNIVWIHERHKAHRDPAPSSNPHE